MRRKALRLCGLSRRNGPIATVGFHQHGDRPHHTAECSAECAGGRSPPQTRCGGLSISVAWYGKRTIIKSTAFLQGHTGPKIASGGTEVGPHQYRVHKNKFWAYQNPGHATTCLTATPPGI